METVVHTCGNWLRRRVSWSNSRQAWLERAGIAFLFLATAAMLWFSSELSLSQQVLLWGCWLGAVAAFLRRGWLKLFGPVLFYDLVRIARRRRYIFLRCLYAIGLTFLLCWVYYIWTLGLPRNEPPKIGDMARLAETFFFTFMIVQSVLVIVLTPAYTAGAIAEEKDRKTLEFLLATDLRNREIVLSKLAARLANMTLILLTGLPILSLTQFFGGIDPDLLLASFAGLGLTMLSLASLSIFTSVYAKKPRDAIVLTYLMAAAYLGLSALSLLLRFVPAVVRFGISLGSVSITVSDLIDWFNAGNLFVALDRVGSSWGLVPLAETLPGILRDYAIFHGLVTLICSTWAVIRLRGVALKQTYGKEKKAPLGVRLVGRPRIGHFPMLWKEIFAEGGLRFGWLGRIIVGVLVLGSFVPGVWIFVDYVLDVTGINQPQFRWIRDPFEELQLYMNIWVRIVGTIVACLMLLGVAVRAASSVSGERDRQTFDGLLTTPLSSHAILVAKWLGSILSVRWAWLWLGAIWAFGMVTLGMTPLAVPLLVMAWVVYAAVFAGVGLWFSMSCRTSLRATMWTIVSVIGLSVGHWVLMSMCCYLPLSASSTMRGRDIDWLLKLEAGQTPPVVLGSFALHGSEFSPGGRFYAGREGAEWIGVCVLGVVCWAVLALVLLGVANARFQVITGRAPFRVSERPRPLPSRAWPRRDEPPLDAIPVVLDVIPALPDGENDDEPPLSSDPPELFGAVEIADERLDDDRPQRPA